MLYILLTHLSAFIEDVKTLQRNGDWIPVQPYAQLWTAGLLCCGEVVHALRKHHLTHDDIQLHRDLIISGLDFSTRWGTWIAELKPDSLRSPAGKVFHEQLLRWFKGGLKAWRIFLVDSTHI